MGNTTNAETANADYWRKMQELAQAWKDKHPQRVHPQQTCPSCGYCPHCGRGGQWTMPQIAWTAPSWTVTSGGTHGAGVFYR